jgi:hypothetical protein
MRYNRNPLLKKWHITPVKTLRILQLKDYILLKTSTNDLTSDAQIPMKKHMKYEKARHVRKI